MRTAQPFVTGSSTRAFAPALSTASQVASETLVGPATARLAACRSLEGVNSNRNWERFMEIFSPEFMSALLAIVVIDLVLAGDNAIVIALAARNVPKHLQKRAIMWGTVGAIAVRSSLTMVVVWLLKVPGLMLAGGAMLIWIAYRLLVPANEEIGRAHV